MGRKKKEDASISTLRWRKYYERKKEANPKFSEDDKKRIRETARNRRIKDDLATKQKNRNAAKSAMRKLRERKKLTHHASEFENLPVYANNRVLAKAVKKVEIALPKNHQKQIAVIHRLVRKIGITKNDLFPKKSDLTEHEQLAVKFYFNPSIVYTMPGINDTVTIRTENGKEKLRKHYLTVFIKEAYAMFVQQYGPVMKRSKFHSLRPKNVFLMKETPQEICKCLYHENMEFLFKSIGSNYDGSFWDEMLCDSELKSSCWSNQCDNCKDFSFVFPNKDLNETVKLRQWVKNENKQLRLTTIDTVVSEVFFNLKTEAQTFYQHVHVKRVQSSAFDLDKKMHNVRVTQFDFAMNFTSEVQREVQSALWGRASIVLFTVASKLNDSDTSMVLVSQNVSKDKKTVFACLYEVLQRLPSIDDPLIQEVFWSDGPSSEFKNKYMVAVLHFFSKKYNKTFTWKYFASSHGKGVVDAIGGNLKSVVRMQTRAIKNEVVVINTAQDFITAAKKGVTNTQLIEISKTKVDQINVTNPIFNETSPVPGIQRMHVIRATKEGKIEFAKNCLHLEDFSD